MIIFQNKRNKNIIFKSKTQARNAQINLIPVINIYNAYILLQYLNILNDAKYSVNSLEM